AAARIAVADPAALLVEIDRGLGVDLDPDARDIGGPERRAGPRLPGIAGLTQPRDPGLGIGRDPVAEQQIDPVLNAGIQVAAVAGSVVVAGRSLGIAGADQLGQVTAGLDVAGAASLQVQPLALADIGCDPDALHVEQRQRAAVGTRRLAAAGRESLDPTLEHQLGEARVLALDQQSEPDAGPPLADVAGALVQALGSRTIDRDPDPELVGRSQVGAAGRTARVAGSLEHRRRASGLSSTADPGRVHLARGQAGLG